MHIPRGSSREQRPALPHVLLDVIVEPQAGMPVLMPPRSGQRSDGHDFGQRITAHLAPVQRTSGTTCLVADSALSRAENLRTLAATQRQWIPRVPATLGAAQAVLAHADPQPRAPLTAGSRSHGVRSRDGGVEQRWGLLHSASRQPQAQRTVDTQRLQHSAQAGTACKQVCRTAVACAADAPQALPTFAQRVQAPFVAQSTIRPLCRSATRGRPGPGTPPDQSTYPLEGALARQSATRQAHIDQHRCVILATTARDDTPVSPQEL